MHDRVFLRRVLLRNYKSIRECSVRLGPLTFLVGPNGSGKSNFLEAIRFVSDSLTTSLEHALRERGGIHEVRRRSSGRPTHFGIRLDWALGDGTDGWYAFRVGAKRKGGFEVQKEECRVFQPGALKEHYFRVEKGQVRASDFKVFPPASSDRLYLVAAAGLPGFRPLYEALSHMGFYNLNPDAIRELQPSDPGEILRRDGRNLASVLRVLEKEDREAYDRILQFLSKITPGVQSVVAKHIQNKETLEFRQLVGTSNTPWRFLAENMSDGTLRALGVLAALFQSAEGRHRRIPFVGIEEPEVALHPGAAGVLRDALRTASRTTQVAVTSHSPDLLDDKEVSDEAILAVAMRNGETTIGPLDRAGRTAVKDRLYTAGELLRLNQLEPDPEIAAGVSDRQLDLFGECER